MSQENNKTHDKITQSTIEIELMNIESVKERLFGRSRIYKRRGPKRTRSLGRDNYFTQYDLVSVYDVTDRRIYYILGRGRAERIIASLRKLKHELMPITLKDKSVRYFRSLIPNIRKDRGDSITWEKSPMFHDFFLCGRLQAIQTDVFQWRIERIE